MTEKIETKKEKVKEPEVKEPEVKEPIVPTEVKEVPEICTFKGVRRIVMKRVWDKADKMEKAGKPMLIGDFGRLVSEEWDIVKKEVPRVCYSTPVKIEALDKPEVPSVGEQISQLELKIAALKEQNSAEPSKEETPSEKLSEKPSEKSSKSEGKD